MKRVLVAAPRWPWPVRSGDRLRASMALRYLASRADVWLATPECGAMPEGLVFQTIGSMSMVPTQVRLASGINALSRLRPFELGWLSPLQFSADISRAVSVHAWDAVHVVTVRAWNDAFERTNAVCVVDYVDALSSNMEREWRRGPQRLPFLVESRLLRRLERLAAASSAKLLTVADRDAAELAKIVGCVPRVVPVPAPIVDAVRPDRASPFVCITGNFGYRPTAEGVASFVRRVWPRIRKEVPDARLLLAGSRIPGDYDRNESVEVVSEPGELSAIFARARVSVCPVWSGSGVQLKVLEAAAHGVPIVTTPFVSDGLRPRLRAAITVARSETEVVWGIAHYLGDPVAASRDGAVAQKAARADYPSDEWESAMDEIYECLG